MIPDKLKVAFIQTTLKWEDSKGNLLNFNKIIESIKLDTDIILLPEMFNTGFSINPAACAETMNGSTVSWLRSKAKEKNSVICGTLLIAEDNAFYNRFIWMQPDGSYFTYDKHHLFRMSEEFRILASGRENITIYYKGWKIRPQICYDLRFPVWSRNRFRNGEYEYDLLLYPANWPASRAHVFKTLLMARAIENQAWVIGVNRIGNDGFGNAHSGDSMIINPFGIPVVQLLPYQDEICYSELDYSMLSDLRQKFPVGLDWDDFKIKS